ncbi:MAG: hypothetical protein RRC34_10255 [Lentisphaeria bacterium]|nr:hypothetical protein [Lentisphaeria bacterium]
MRLKTTLFTGCVFLIGVGIGMIAAAVVMWRATVSVAEEAAADVSQSPLAIEKTIRHDERLMTSVEKLGEIPEIRDALLDPDIADALEKKDYLKLLNNETFRELARHPAVKDLSRDVIKRHLSDWLKKSPPPAAPPPAGRNPESGQ